MRKILTLTPSLCGLSVTLHKVLPPLPGSLIMIMSSSLEIRLSETQRAECTQRQ